MLRFHIIFAALLCLMWACGGDRALTETLDRADALMEAHPDSALALLRPYDGAKIRSEAQRARFALLYSMALDKNFIDTIDFKVLQPALDYYPTHGTNADKLRTLYYEGRIYENADRMNEAMQAWAEGLQYAENASDSLTWARLLVAQGNGYFNLYRINRYIENNQQAEKIYRLKKRDFDAYKAMLRAFNGALSYNDSLSAFYRQKSNLLLKESTRNGYEARNLALLHEIRYGTSEAVTRFINEFSPYGIDSLDLAQAWLELDNPSKAVEVFPSIQTDTTLFGNIKYNRTKAQVLAANKEYKEAWIAFNSYLNNFDLQLSEGAIGDMAFIEERTKWRDTVRHNREMLLRTTVIGCLLIALLISVVALIYSKSQLNKILRLQIEEKLQKLMLLRDYKLRCDKSEKQMNAILEDKKSVLSEIPAEESTSTQVPEPIKEKLNILGSLIKKALSGSKQMDLKSIISNDYRSIGTPHYLENNGKVLEAFYPATTSELLDKGITYEELGFMYLHLMGLNGKEIGELLKKRSSHYKISSAIRKKLGLTKNDKNLSLFVRELFEEGKN